MKLLFLASISIFIVSQMAFAQNNSPKGFAIYALSDFKPNQLSNLNLKTLKPKGTPIISESEIQYYQKETHEFRIDYSASERLKKINDAGGAKSFAVFVGNEAIYAGAFWKSILSQSFDGVIIDTFKPLGKPPYFSNTDYPVLTLELGYPSAEYFKGTDLRADSRIFKALEDAGKLYEEIELVVKCKNIYATGKRRASFVFTLSVEYVTKGNFAEKEFTIELYDRKMLAEFDADTKFYSGETVKFNTEQEVILKISQQIGKEKPEWFLREYKKK